MWAGCVFSLRTFQHACCRPHIIISQVYQTTPIDLLKKHDRWIPLHIIYDYRKNRKITFTILSAYFISHDTSKPVDPKFKTTIHVVKVYPLKMRCHHGPLSKPTWKSSHKSRTMLNIAPNLTVLKQEKWIFFFLTCIICWQLKIHKKMTVPYEAQER